MECRWGLQNDVGAGDRYAAIAMGAETRTQAALEEVAAARRARVPTRRLESEVEKSVGEKTAWSHKPPPPSES